MDFSKKEIDRIHKEITQAEEKTSAEIVIVVAEMSDDYKYVPLLWAALFALILPAPLFYFGDMSGPDIYFAQLAVFCLFSFILSLPIIRIHIVPPALKRKRCHKCAMEQFLTQNLLTTSEKTGILIYVSHAEKYCEIIADEGIYEKLDPSFWQEQVDILTRHIAKGKMVDGFSKLITENGKHLAKHFPAGEENPNELPNHLILL